MSSDPGAPRPARSPDQDPAPTPHARLGHDEAVPDIGHDEAVADGGSPPLAERTGSPRPPGNEVSPGRVAGNEATRSAGNEAPPERVAAMFDRISGVYDAMNLAISGFQEPRWRHRAVREAVLGPGDRALDVACGTGKVTRDLWRAVQPGGSATGVDFSTAMIERAVDRSAAEDGPCFLVGDALALPVDHASFDAATIAFGMRNLADYQRGFEEMARAVRPGGRVVCLEIARPTSRLGRLAGRWFDSIVPLIGRLVGQGSAYAYLVQSTKDYPPPDDIARIMRAAGLHEVDWFGLSFGMVTIHTGRVPVGPTGQA